MKRKLIIGAALALLFAATGYGAYRLGMKQGMSHAPAALDGRRVLYWHDPMVPGQRFDKPGKSPFMDMDLVPVYADGGGEQARPGQVSIDPRVSQNLGMRLAEARKGSLAPMVQAVGNVAFDEHGLTVLQARAGGYVERLHVRAPFDRVRKGQPLVQLYVPEWIAAQEDYLATRRMPAGAASAGLVEAALQRMRLAGMTEAQIRTVTASGAVNARITVTAPASGVVSELAVREGMTVAPGTTLFRINTLDTVWLNAEVPESAAAQVRPGTPVQVSAAAFPGQRFEGKVEALLPDVDAATRTLKARIKLDNPGHKLVPGMFASVRLSPPASAGALLVPSEAVIRTGTRNVVILALGEGRFAPAEVEVGAEAEGQTEILGGLSEGQKLVASGQFLIDSEASLRGALGQLSTPAAATYRTHGTVEDIAQDEVMISHAPVPALKWGAMTMGFVPPKQGMPPGVAVGSAVEFSFQAREDGSFAITAIAPRGHGGHR
jgi:Cu(I)/Ag(I) efflux system membrane fusion protein